MGFAARCQTLSALPVNGAAVFEEPFPFNIPFLPCTRCFMLSCRRQPGRQGDATAQAHCSPLAGAGVYSQGS